MAKDMAERREVELEEQRMAERQVEIEKEQAKLRWLKEQEAAFHAQNHQADNATNNDAEGDVEPEVARIIAATAVANASTRANEGAKKALDPPVVIRYVEVVGTSVWRPNVSRKKCC